jgi:hypothetical protein
MAKEKNFARSPRIRSGGQTGVDRAALDAAVLTGRPYEGWCPKGGWAEDFLRPPGLLTIYPHLMETPSESPEQRTEWNVRDSAATVVFVPDSKYCSRGTDFTIECAKKYGGTSKNIPLWRDDRRSRSRRGGSFNPWRLTEAAGSRHRFLWRWLDRLNSRNPTRGAPVHPAAAAILSRQTKRRML